MSESVFLTLTYIYMLFNRKHFNQRLISDFRDDVFRIYRFSSDVHCFCNRFETSFLSLRNDEYRLRRNFLRFIRENNSLLGYKY